MTSSVSPQELHDISTGGTPVTIIDTLPPEYWECGHIPGAVNACVYEMVFLEKVAASTSDHAMPIVVYGSSDRSRGAAVAAEKLTRAGYTNIRELAGGIEAWESAGFPLEPTGAQRVEEPVISAGRYLIKPELSRLEWMGRNVNNRHMGTIQLAGGEVHYGQDGFVGGAVTLAMDTIANLDLQDEEYRAMLIRHLMSDDFFNVVRYPSASYTIHGSETLPNAAPGAPNYLITGELELNGITRRLHLPTEVVPLGNGQLKAHAAIDLDRTLWGAIYGSGRFFEKLGIHLVSDMVSIELFLVAERA
ncbi:MAG TPA: rhodanese-like domain-containing protein [Desulfuromonadaceae bacterium]